MFLPLRTAVVVRGNTMVVKADIAEVCLHAEAQLYKEPIKLQVLLSGSKS